MKRYRHGKPIPTIQRHSGQFNSLGFTDLPKFENAKCGNGCLNSYRCLFLRETHGCLRKIQLKLDRYLWEVANVKYIFGDTL